MTWTKLFFILIAIVAIAVAISIFGPMSSRYVDRKIKMKIDKNGKEVNGVVTGKGQWTGRQIYFVYRYHGKVYHGEQDYGNYLRDDYKYFDSLKEGDAVSVQIDSLLPHDSYIIR